MAEYPEKGFVPVSMQPDSYSSGQDPRPPPYYSGVPFEGPSSIVYDLPSYPTVSLSSPPDSVQLSEPTAPPPRDYVLWSLFNTMFCNIYCLGFVALTYAIKSRDRLVMGDITSARRYGITARSLNISIVCVSIISMAVILIMVWSMQ